MIYVVIALFLLILSFLFDSSQERRGKKIGLFCAWIVLVLLSGLRYKVGGDTYNYMYSYDSLPTFLQLFDNARYEPLYLILCFIAKTISPDFVVLQLLHAIILNTIIFVFIKNNTRYVFFGVFIYFLFYYCYFNMEIMRESLAVAVFLLSINYFTEKKWIRYYLCALIASGFHLSAVILFIFPLFQRFVLDKKSIIVLFAIFIIGIFTGDFFVLLISHLPFTELMMTKYLRYTDYSFTVIGIIFSLVKYLFMPIFLYCISKKMSINKEYYHFLFGYAFMGCLIPCFAIFQRMTNYTTPIVFIVITNLLYAIVQRTSLMGKIPVSLFIFVFFFSFYNFTHFQKSKHVTDVRWISRWYPYYSVFEKKIDNDRERMISTEFDRNDY